MNNSLFTAFTTTEKDNMIHENLGYLNEDEELFESYPQNNVQAPQNPVLQQPATAARPVPTYQQNVQTQPVGISLSDAIRNAAPIIGQSAPQVGQMPEWNALYQNPTAQSLSALIIKIAGIAATAQKTIQLQNSNTPQNQNNNQNNNGMQAQNSSLEIDFLKQMNLSEEENNKIFKAIFEEDSSVMDASASSSADKDKNIDSSKNDNTNVDSSVKNVDSSVKDKPENPDTTKKEDSSAKKTDNPLTSTRTDNSNTDTAGKGGNENISPDGADTALNYSEEYKKGEDITPHERDQNVKLTKPEPFVPDNPKLEVDFSNPESIRKSIGEKTENNITDENFSTGFSNSLNESLSEDILDTIVGEWKEEYDDETPSISDIINFISRKFPEVLKDDSAIDIIRKKIEETSNANANMDLTDNQDFINADNNFDEENSSDDDYTGSEDFIYDEDGSDELDDDLFDESKHVPDKKLSDAVFEYEMNTNESDYNINEATRWLDKNHKELIPKKNKFLYEIKNFYTEDAKALNDDFYSDEPTLD